MAEFLNFTPADGLNADSLLQCIKRTLSQCNIDVSACIGQCYDGAVVMSGCNNGVQEKFRKEVPHALYVHCHAHRLNFTLVDVYEISSLLLSFSRLCKCSTIFFLSQWSMTFSRKN